MLHASNALLSLLTGPAPAGPGAHCLLPNDGDDGDVQVPYLLPVDGDDGGVHVPCLPNSVPRCDGGLQVMLAKPVLAGLVLLLLADGLALLPGLCRAAPGLSCSPGHNLLLFPGLC